MHRPRANPFASGLVAAIVLAVLMIGVVISGIPGGPQVSLPWNQKVSIKVQLADADALAPHASVEVAGVKVGEVESVVANGTYAVATMQILSQYSDIHTDATVFLRAHGLFGPKYIAIIPGTTKAPVVGDGGTILVNQTVQPVDLNSILQDLQAPEQQNLRTLIVEFGQAAAGRGDDVNHLLSAANVLTKTLDSPVRSLDAVSPQLSDMLIKNESFNAYFAQTPLDQLVANSEQTIQVFSANATHLQSLLSHANTTLASLETALGGNGPQELQSIIQLLGDSKNGTIVKLDEFTYLLGLFGYNLTGADSSVGKAAQNATGGIIGAIENVKSAFVAGDPCPTGAAGTNENHCAAANSLPGSDHLQHYLHVRVFNFAPSLPATPTLPTCLPIIIPGLPTVCLPSGAAATVNGGQAFNAGSEWSGMGALFAS